MTEDDEIDGVATVSKAEFARLTNKSRSLVSKWIKRGTINDEALVGEPGPGQRICASIALEQLRTRRDIGQAHGNGLATKLGPFPAGKPDPKEVDAQTDPFGSAALASDDFGRGAIVMGLALIYEAGTLAASLAVAAGATMEIAYALRQATTIGTMHLVEDILARLGRMPPSELVFDTTAFVECDWRNLAALSGQEFQREACEAWLAAKFGKA